MKTQARLQAAAYALNAMLEKDSDAINKLFALKVVASNALCLCMPTHAQYCEDYPTVKLIGAMEMINALCATDTMYIVPVKNTEGEIIMFSVRGVKKPKLCVNTLSDL